MLTPEHRFWDDFSETTTPQDGCSAAFLAPACPWTPFALETRSLPRPGAPLPRPRRRMTLPRSGQGRPDPRPWVKTAQTVQARTTSGPAISRHGTKLGEAGHSPALRTARQLRGQDPAHREGRRMSQRSGENGTPAAARPDPSGKAALRLVVLRLLKGNYIPVYTGLRLSIDASPRFC